MKIPANSMLKAYLSLSSSIVSKSDISPSYEKLSTHIGVITLSLAHIAHDVRYDLNGELSIIM